MNSASHTVSAPTDSNVQHPDNNVQDTENMANHNYSLSPPCTVPEDPSLVMASLKHTMFSTMLIVLSPYLIYLALANWDHFTVIYTNSQRESIKETFTYQDPELVSRLWKETKIGTLYFSAVEYQLQEGYCGSATMRCILKSLVSAGKLSEDKVPETSSGPMTATRFANLIDQVSNGALKSHLVLGSEGYDAFLQAIKLANNPEYRIALNFLRSPIFGTQGSVALPVNFMKTFFGGHFSPIVGYLEDRDLVAVFDVNHNYGLFFVDSKRLYDAVNTYDLQSGVCRALIVSHIEQ